ncbi:MAG: Imm7 family immunity protein [Chloroflexota bacterium]
MFEFHGWIKLQVDDSDDADIDVLVQRMNVIIEKVQEKIKETDDNLSHFNIAKAGNGLNFVSVHGLRNHRFEPIIDLFKWAAAHLPECYGLLYVWDDEDQKREENYENCFRVWRLAQGQIDEKSDPFLSPCVPTIEKPYHFQ